MSTAASSKWHRTAATSATSHLRTTRDVVAPLRRCCFTSWPVPSPYSSVITSAVSCSDCGRSFSSEEALQQHAKAKHAAPQSATRRTSLSAEAFDPPIDEPGHWVERNDFHGRKSFGAFKCRCKKVWVSAHAFPIYKQVRRSRLPQVCTGGRSGESCVTASVRRVGARCSPPPPPLLLLLPDRIMDRGMAWVSTAE